jgi:hypothetical protein
MGRRPGRSLATLLAAGAVSNLGDGVTLAAAPLLAASVTRDPRAIGAVGWPGRSRGCCSRWSAGRSSTGRTAGG